MNDFVKQVKEFQKTFDPKNYSDDKFHLESLDLGAAQKLLCLRLDLIREEYNELEYAVDNLIDIIREARANHRSIRKHLETCDAGGALLRWHNNKVEVADALGDLLVVVIGTSMALGLDIEEIMKRIYASNMSKLGSDGKPIYRSDGKVMKGPYYVPPRLDDLV